MKCRCQEQYYKKLKGGQIVEIFNDNNKFEGIASLIECEDRTASEPYMEIESCRFCGKQLNLIKERWLVEFIPSTKFEKPFITHRKIPVLYGHGIIHIKDEID